MAQQKFAGLLAIVDRDLVSESPACALRSRVVSRDILIDLWRFEICFPVFGILPSSDAEHRMSGVHRKDRKPSIIERLRD